MSSFDKSQTRKKTKRKKRKTKATAKTITMKMTMLTTQTTATRSDHPLVVRVPARVWWHDVEMFPMGQIQKTIWSVGLTLMA